MDKNKTINGILKILTSRVKVSNNGFSGEDTICGLFTASGDITEYIYDNFKEKDDG